MIEDKELEHQVQQIETLVQRIEEINDPNLKAGVRELVQSFLQVYGAGLERVLEIISRSGDSGHGILESLGRDRLVGSLLILYGLHPLDLKTRVGQAVDKLRPNLLTHGANVEVLEISEDAVRLRLQTNGSGCGSSIKTLKLAIEEAICEAAPDVMRIEVEAASEPAASAGFVPLESLKPVSVPGGSGLVGIKSGSTKS